MIDIQTILTTVAGGCATLVGWVYTKHTTRIEKLETDVDNRTTEKDVELLIKPMEVKLDNISEDLKEIKYELLKMRKYS